MFTKQIRFAVLISLLSLLLFVANAGSTTSGFTVGSPNSETINAVSGSGLSIGHISGVTYDSTTGELIVIGVESTQLTAMDYDYLLDNLIVAIRSRLNPAPGVSLEPIAGNTEFQEMIYFPDAMANTHFGDVLARADIILKVMSLGRDNETGNPISLTVPGYKSVVQRLAEANWNPTETNISWRMFIELQATMVLTPNSSAGFNPSKVVTVDWAFENGSDAVVQTAVQGFIDHLNQNYDAYAAEFAAMGNTSLEEVAELGKLMAVAGWLQVQEIPIPLSGAPLYTPQAVSSPHMVPIIEVPVTLTSVEELSAVQDRVAPGPFYLIAEPVFTAPDEVTGSTILLVGGVDFSLLPTNHPDNGEWEALAGQGLTTRTGQSWTFDGQAFPGVPGRPAEIEGGATVTYTAVAIPLDAALQANFLPFVSVPGAEPPSPSPASWRINNTVGGSLSASLTGFGTHNFPSGTSTWTGITPGTYSYSLTAVGGPCNGGTLNGTHTFVSGVTIIQDVTCGTTSLPDDNSILAIPMEP
jgi:hypothetical protein